MLVAYVVGFENERTQIVFGAQDYKPFLSLPDASNNSPSFIERISSYFLVFIPWLVVYEAFIYIGAQKDAIITNLPFEENWPIWEFSEIFYSSVYLFVLLVPLIIKTREKLRCFIIDTWFATIIVGIIYLVFPFIVSQRVFVPHSFLGHMILFERSVDGVTGALPSFHVIWAFLSARYFSRSVIRYKWIWYFLAVLISVSCITTGSHSLLDVVAGLGMFFIVKEMGRMALTNYLMQTLINILIFNGIGFGLAGKIGPSIYILWFIFLMILQIFFSKWWLSKYRFGPFEWLWRSLTYNQMQPMKI